MKIYLTDCPGEGRGELAGVLRESGHEVHEPAHGWMQLKEEIVRQGSSKSAERDMQALRECDICILTIPYHKAAEAGHMEAGYVIGRGGTVILVIDDFGDSLPVHRLAHYFCASASEVQEAVKDAEMKKAKAVAA